MTADTLPGFRVYRWSRRDGGMWLRDRCYLDEAGAKARVRMIERLDGVAATYEAEPITQAEFVRGG